MASIVSTEVTFIQDAGPVARVAIALEFTPREVSENFTYGVNVAVLRLRADQQVFTRHKGYTAMELFALPPDPTTPLQVAFKSTTVKPNGTEDVTLTVDAGIYGAVVSGEQLQALVTVVPEIAETTNLSPMTRYP